MAVAVCAKCTTVIGRFSRERGLRDGVLERIAEPVSLSSLTVNGKRGRNLKFTSR